MASFKDEWFSNPHWWFSATEQDDLYLSNKYGYLLWNNSDCDDLTRIIIYDQLSRHVLRKECAKHVIDFYLQKAISITERILRSFHGSVQEWCFVLLPLRHSNSWSNFMIVLKHTWELMKNVGTPEDVRAMKRFLQATYDRGPLGFVKEYPEVCIPRNMNLDCTRYAHLLQNTSICVDWNAPKLTFEHEFETSADMYIVSLSGGVDSMVTSFILRRMGVKNIVAVHINYKNKAHCDEESQFIKDWCNYIGIPLYIREIVEIQRAPCMKYEMRSCYEEYTRRVRYTTYKQVAKVFGFPHNFAVLMGHNRDDCFENLLTNIAYGQKYDELKGMTKVSVVDDIVFVRPLLDTSKEMIREFAMRAGIPHLHDSTPSWSQRGKIRDLVVPALKNWDSRIVDGLFVLANSMKDMYSMQNAMVDEYVRNTTKDGVLNNYSRVLPTSFWKAYFNRAIGNPPVSNKCIAQFCDKLKKFEAFKMPLRKDILVRVDQNHVAFSRQQMARCVERDHEC